MNSNTLEIGLAETAILQAGVKKLSQDGLKPSDRMICEQLMYKLELAFSGLKIRVDIEGKK